MRTKTIGLGTQEVPKASNIHWTKFSVMCSILHDIQIQCKHVKIGFMIRLRSKYHILAYSGGRSRNQFLHGDMA